MPFEHPMRPYTNADVRSINRNQNGVYGIFRDNTAVYIGSGDIRERMLAHLSSDNACIVRENPNQWTAETLSGDPTAKEGELIREYEPICNLVIPR